mmetsp:Transcript_40534/g.41369  ORF Transcript_40534/g.41369 Transcript_40534/m.41369 type:complete len:370 (-) Transcript_40534:556-1665(-)|eukprot:CAMPEP_0182419210 /NCGR_PEP_ID=MMETSP1167-20130531/3625_1 /TAXON_ID=2988 /ORGANISM="Mallomonas Sp, Strain CCMP3275" /LENGTH=369 /DNA_ID=CAMNT_0024593927 /DNA_START=71 /DNA_END=1180 /DNA_ORIENTATION=+
MDTNARQQQPEGDNSNSSSSNNNVNSTENASQNQYQQQQANWQPGAPAVYYAYPPHPEGIPVPQVPTYGYYSAYAGQVYYPPAMVQGSDESLDQDDQNQIEIDNELRRSALISPSPDGDAEYQEYNEQTEEELAVMDELQEEIDKIAVTTPESPKPTTQQNNSGNSRGASTLPAGATPGEGGVLNAHAAEFWFPECRNCTCCNGFKHGCSCCKNGVNTCQNESCVNEEFTSQVASTLAARGTSAPVSSSTSSAAPSQGSYARAAPAPPVTGYGYTPPPQSYNSGGAGPCRYFLQGSCRFGASCRFVHTRAPTGQTDGGTGAPTAPRSYGDNSGMSRQTPCRYYMSNMQCHYGDSCRYSHSQSDIQAANN